MKYWKLIGDKNFELFIEENEDIKALQTKTDEAKEAYKAKLEKIQEEDLD